MQLIFAETNMLWIFCFVSFCFVFPDAFNYSHFRLLGSNARSVCLDSVNEYHSCSIYFFLLLINILGGMGITVLWLNLKDYVVLYFVAVGVYLYASVKCDCISKVLECLQFLCGEDMSLCCVGSLKHFIDW